MAVADPIIEQLGTDNFADYERSVYNSYQETAEREIVEKLNVLLATPEFIQILKMWAARCGCKFDGFRDINIRLKSGQKWKVSSPIFLKAKPKKRGRSPKRQKGDCGILALNYLALSKR